MKIFFSLWLASILALASLIGCPGNTPTPAVPDADSASGPVIGAACASGITPTICGAACAVLQLTGCPIGKQPDCASLLVRDLGTCKVPNATTLKALTCIDIEAVKTPQDAIKLGFTCGDL